MTVLKVLVDYDTLQDTRLGVLQYHNKAEALYYINNQHAWHNRIMDKTNSIDLKTFELFYANRAETPEEVLATPITPMIFIIAKLVKENIDNADSRFYDTRMGIHINIWPYEMSHSVRETLRLTLFKYLDVGPIVDLSIVRLPPKDITPRRLFEEYQIYYTYGLKEWIAAQGEELLKFQIPNNVIVTPKLFRNDDHDVMREVEKHRDTDCDLFDAIAREHRGLIDIQFLDVSYFSFMPLPEDNDVEFIQSYYMTPSSDNP